MPEQAKAEIGARSTWRILSRTRGNGQQRQDDRLASECSNPSHISAEAKTRVAFKALRIVSVMLNPAARRIRGRSASSFKARGSDGFPCPFGTERRGSGPRALSARAQAARRRADRRAAALSSTQFAPRRPGRPAHGLLQLLGADQRLVAVQAVRYGHQIRTIGFHQLHGIF